MSRGPRSLLFLSCDLVGSTKYKQSNSTIWHKTFLSFYRQFPQMLGDVANEHGSTLEFTLWKPIGDELIFTVEVDHEADVYNAVRIWLATMRRYEDEVFRKVRRVRTAGGAVPMDGDLNDGSDEVGTDGGTDEGGTGGGTDDSETEADRAPDQDDSRGTIALATKGGAFIATFPGPDSESSIPINPKSERSDAGVVELNDEALEERDGSRFMFDYFGPSIDTGFRVLSACSQRYFTLSVEVAWAMAQCVADAGATKTPFQIDDMRLDDLREFKGVWDGREYPMFTVDRDVEDTVNVAVARIRRQKLHAWDVVNLCRACQDSEGWPSRLYLPGSRHDEYFGTVPDDPLDEFRTYSTDGLEHEPTLDGGKDDLEDNAPLGGDTASKAPQMPAPKMAAKKPGTGSPAKPSAARKAIGQKGAGKKKTAPDA